jgi:hypothetical protein
VFGMALQMNYKFVRFIEGLVTELLRLGVVNE